MPVLRNWKLCKYYSSVELKPVYYIIGKVYNDTRFEDGTEIRTSTVQEITETSARTRNTTYILE
jgi:hypothetical protein